MEFNFVERDASEKGFSEVYQRDVVPFLKDMERRRQRAIAKSQRIIGIIAVVAAFLAWKAYAIDPVLPIMPVAIGGFACLFFYISRGDKLQGELTEFIRPILVDFLSDVKFEAECSATDVQLARLERLCLVPRSERRSLGPKISGRWRDVSYQMVHARFYERYRDSDNKQRTRTLFRGILIKIECWNPMPTIVFLPDFGSLGNKMYAWASRNIRPPHRLELPSELEEYFEVYTDDPNGASQALDTSFGHKILEMSKELRGRKDHISSAFEGESFFMAAQLDHAFLSFDVMNRPMNEVDEKIHQAFDDLTIPRRIIDRLLED